MLNSWRELVCCTVLTVLSVGCSSRGGQVAFESSESNRTLVQTFNQAYVARAEGGEYDVVLVDNAPEVRPSRPKKNQPLQPTPLSPVQEVMHIHLYWQPMVGTTKN